MFYSDNLIVVGSKNNCINISRLMFSNENYQIEDIGEIKLSTKTMIHSCLIIDNSLYIIDSFNNNVIKYNIDDKEFMECNTGKDPRHVCRCLDYLYVTNFESDSISLIDVDKYVLTATMMVGVKPHGILANDSNTKIYIACYEENEILEYDIKTGEKKYLSIKGKPMHLFIYNNCLFVLTYILNDYISTEIYSISLENYEIIKTYLINEITTNFVYDKDTNRLFALAIESGIVYRINLDNDQIKKQMHLNGYLEDISVSNQYLYIVNSNRNYISVIDKYNFKLIDTIYLEFSPLYIKAI